jgi:hypothetical protein
LLVATVAFVVWNGAQKDAVMFPFGAVFVMFPSAVIDQPRAKLVLPIDRASRLRRHAQAIMLGLAFTLAMIVLVDVVSLAIASRWSVPRIATNLRGQWLVAAIFCCLQMAIVPFVGIRALKGLVLLALFAVSYVAGTVLSTGLVTTAVACLLTTAAVWGWLVAHYRASDL